MAIRETTLPRPIDAGLAAALAKEKAKERAKLAAKQLGVAAGSVWASEEKAVGSRQTAASRRHKAVMSDE